MGEISYTWNQLTFDAHCNYAQHLFYKYFLSVYVCQEKHQQQKRVQATLTYKYLFDLGFTVALPSSPAPPPTHPQVAFCCVY